MSENTISLNYAAAEPDIEYVQNELKELLNNKPLCTILGDEFTEHLRDWDKAITCLLYTSPSPRD